MNSKAQDFLTQESMTNDLYFHTREFSRIFLRIVSSLEQFFRICTYLVSAVFSGAFQRIKSGNRKRWSLSLGLNDPEPWSPQRILLL